MNWSQCSDVERAPGKVSGAWVVKGTRVPAQAVIDNAKDGYTPEEIAGEIFEGLPVGAGAIGNPVRRARPKSCSTTPVGVQMYLSGFKGFWEHMASVRSIRCTGQICRTKICSIRQ